MATANGSKADISLPDSGGKNKARPVDPPAPARRLPPEADERAQSRSAGDGNVHRGSLHAGWAALSLRFRNILDKIDKDVLDGSGSSSSL